MLIRKTDEASIVVHWTDLQVMILVLRDRKIGKQDKIENGRLFYGTKIWAMEGNGFVPSF